MFSFEKFGELWHNKWLFGAVMAFVAAILAIFLSNIELFENLELKSYNLRFALRGEMDMEDDDIAIVAIDDESFMGLGWPFPRTYYAKAILNLHEAGAKLIIVDVEFTEARNDSADLLLAASILRTKNVLLAGKVVNEIVRGRDMINSYLLPPIQLLLDAGAHWGLINIDQDVDAFVRRYLLFQSQSNNVYPMSLTAYQLLQQSANGTANVNIDDDGFFVIGDLRVPKKDYNSMLINFRGPAGTFPTYSFSSILDDSSFTLAGDDDTDMFEIHKEMGTFQDKIVFIGASAEELQDNKFTPFFKFKGIQRKLPGVEVHANALSTLLRGDFISVQGKGWVILTLFLMSAFAMILTKWLKPFRGMFAVLGLMLFIFILALYAFNNHQVWFEITGPMLAIVLSYVGNVVHETLTEQRERIRIKKSWQQFMSKNVIDDMLASGKLPTFGGERRELTVLFSDIRSFTNFSEKHSPQAVVEKLGEYLTEMVDVIFKNEGTLDKFVGDEIMALYGAPHYFEEHAEKACQTALEMMERLRVLQKKWSDEGEDSFEIGIGINSGNVILGNLGSSQLFDYTVIGDDVNLGARLEGTNKQYGTAIIISESTYKEVKGKVKVRELDLVRVKGKSKPVKIFELLGMQKLSSIEEELLVEAYSQGLENYKRGKWYRALLEFKKVLRHFPNDGPTKVYIRRCLDFMENPPVEHWDGVYEFTTK